MVSHVEFLEIFSALTTPNNRRLTHGLVVKIHRIFKNTLDFEE